jgi:uncharacterized protein (TIGR03000 family)
MAQAKDYPGGYDPATGLTWDQEFRYDPVTNPFGSREPEYQRTYRYSGANYSYGYPVYSSAPQGSYYYGYPVYSSAPPANYSYGAYAPGSAVRDNTARIRVNVPAGAKLWFDDKPTMQTGAVRYFESPALKPGHEYSYEVKAQWRDADGKEVTRTRQVDVSANADASVDFTR